MSQEFKQQDEDQQERAGLQHAAEHASPGKKNSLLLYLVILFAAAFLLLLMSYLMQKRTNEETITGLQQTSHSAVQSLDNLIAERDALKKQVSDLEQSASQREEDLGALQKQIGELERQAREAALQLEAMDWFWQIDDYYTRGFYRNARELIETFEGRSLESHLPTENTTGTDRFSPAQRYQEIRSALFPRQST